MAVTRKATAALTLTLTGEAEAGAAKAAFSEDLGGSALSLLNGVLEDQINRWWADKSPRHLDAAATETIDLFDFASTTIQGDYDGEDPVGQPLSGVSAVCCILVKLKEAADSGQLVVGGAGGTDAWGNLFDDDDNGRITLESSTLQPGVFLWWNPKGLAVTDVSDHKLKFEAKGGGCDYSLYLGMRG